MNKNKLEQPVNPELEYELAEYSKLFKDVKDLDKVTSKVLWSIFKENFWEFIVSTIFFLIKHSPVFVLPLVTSQVINIATNPDEHPISGLYICGVVIAVFVIQNIFTHVIYSKYVSKVLRSIGADFRNSLVKKLQQMSLTGRKDFESGVLQAKFIRDIESIETFLNQIVTSLIPAIITILITAGITFVKSPLMALFFLLVLPVNVLVVRFFRRPMGEHNRSFRKTMEETSAQLANMIEMLPITKAHGLEVTEIKKMKKNIDDLTSAGYSLDIVTARFGSAAWAVGQLLSSVCLIFTGILAYNGIIPVGDVALYQSYFSTLSGNIQGLLNMVPQFTKGSESLRSVSEIIISDNIEDNRGKIKLRYVHGTIQFKNVSYKYPDSDEYIIKNFNLNVEPGECVAFVGGSGSGKTTIMNMIIGFLQPTKGELAMDGKPMEYLNLTTFRKFISVVSQNCVLFPGTIKENIVYGLDNVTEEQINQVVELANIKEFVDDLPDGLDTYIEEHGGNLSGGQKQRISIARALIRDPKIIILDEATSALDNISEYHIQQAMDTLIKGRTTFIVAHRLSTIRNADRIVVMEKGECIETGTYEELMQKKGAFYQLKTLSDFAK